MRRIILPILLTLGLGLGLGLAATVGPAAPAHAAGAAVELCNNANNLLVCMNRNGGGTSDGTYIIGWHPNDPNNGFEWLKENARCGGAVHFGCPFNDPLLNQLYAGYAIVRAYSYDTNKCLRRGPTDTGGGIRGALGGCNDFGHSYVLPGCLASDFINCSDNQFHNVSSVDITNLQGGARCFAWAVNAIGSLVEISDDCASDAQDAVQQAFF